MTHPKPPDVARTEKSAAVTVTPYPDGPMIIRGDFELRDIAGEPIEHSGSAVALCRCGRSTRKPFCDGSHKHHKQRPASD